MTLEEIISRLEQQRNKASLVAKGHSLGNDERAIGAEFVYDEVIKLLHKFNEKLLLENQLKSHLEETVSNMFYSRIDQHQRLSTNAVYTAIRHYQKQGHCEDTEYETLERATEAMIKPHLPNYVRPEDD